MSSHVLLTGVTGFVGKVVLEQLVRRKDELGVGRVTVLVRPGKSRDGKPKTPESRFRKEVVASQCFSLLPRGWDAMVDVVGADLEKPELGIDAANLKRLSEEVTHVVHCAASVEFDLPVAEAASANIKSALAMLELARSCKKLVGMVDVSTAYVSRWREGAIKEELAPLPQSAEALYRAFRTTEGSGEEWLKLTGHPNTYTLTKCVAEHLLSERRGNVPLVIVRPSIVSVAWDEPFRGWIDSNAALAGCLLYTGLGVARAFRADPDVRLDVVPVDVVAREVVNAAYAPMPKPSEPVRIRHATMGTQRALRIDLTVNKTLAYFKARPGVRRSPDMFVGKKGQGFSRKDFFRREVPLQLARAVLTVTRRTKDLKKLEKADSLVRYLNACFAYFTHHTFDFRTAEPLEVPGFDCVEYIDAVDKGMYKHLLRRDETRLSFAGPKHDDARGKLEWLSERPKVVGTMKAFALGLRETMRRCTSDITVDLESFHRAVAQVPTDSLIVLAPSHRSYFDFLLMSYLCFQHSELGIPVPHIAAAQEFSKIPVVGKILRDSQAFFVKRGVGREVPELSEELRRLASKNASLMVFIEGQRSRARLHLPPKRGLLRGLQNTGRNFTVLPISISYDRLPEEAALIRELEGGPRSKMSLPAVMKWMGQMARGEVKLGNIHIACGQPQMLGPDTDTHLLTRSVMSELQQHTTVSSYHLRAFLAEGGLGKAIGIDEAWLRQAIEARGGRVIDSALALPEKMTPTLAQSLRNQWQHWFYPDALARHSTNVAVREHIERNGWMSRESVAASNDPKVAGVVDALFAPISRAYATAAEQLAAHVLAGRTLNAVDMMRTHRDHHLPHLEEALAMLAERRVVHPTAHGQALDEALAVFSASCALSAALPNGEVSA